MNLEEKIELRISKLVTLSIAIFFVLSLSLHNHTFYLGNSSFDKVSKSEPTYPNHSSDFCPACRLNGNFKPSVVSNTLDFSFFGIVITFLSSDVLIPSSFLASNKSPRSPPIV
ncbi:MAG: hypothetical protein HW396_276 [Candidatus Dadabacteria bacterium]|jgi:hypothetical protein|nr:hypothetical protein [Candidatus Dadabacteria bacterium]